MILKKKIILEVLILIFLVVILSVIFLMKQKKIQVSDKEKLSDFTVCTNSVEMPECIRGDSAPVLSWKFDSQKGISKQKSFEVQIGNDNNFESLAYDSGPKESAKKKFVLNTNNLDPEKQYFWRIRVCDENGNWSNWITSEELIKLSPICK